MKKAIAIPIHFLVFVLSVFYTSKNLNFFTIFTTIVENNYLHILHTTLLVHILFLAVFSISDRALGPLSDSEAVVYNEKMYSMLGDITLMISSFPSELDMKIMIYFAFFYAVKSISWTFSLKSQRTSTNKMFLGGLFLTTISAICTYMCCISVKRKMSILVLFVLEYSLIAFGLLKSLLIMALDLLEVEKRRTLVVFLISIVYCLVKAFSYLAFTVVVTVSYKFPMSTARSFLTALMKLYKKLKLFTAYIKLSRDLDSVPEVEINGVCAICTDDLTTGKMLKCTHSFHSECLKQWCERETTCPICRSELIFKREEYIETENEVISGIPIEVDE